MRRSLPTVLGVAALSVGVLPAVTAAPAAATGTVTESTTVLASATFDRSTDGWYAQSGAVVAHVDGAARLTARTAGDAVLDDDPASVPSTVAGARYRATVKVRSSGALPVELRLREYGAGTGTETSTVTTRSGVWTTLTADYQARANGSRLGVNVVLAGARAGQAVDVDDVRVSVVAAPTSSASGWKMVYRNDFGSLNDVGAWNSTTDLNDRIRPGDSDNSSLQKPTIKENVVVTPDAATADGKALAVWTRPGAYRTSSGVKVGWANGRFALKDQDQVPPFHIKTRLRMTASMGAKSAVMWWPSGGGWPWEVDFAESFGGRTLTDYWGGRQNIAQRWHADLNKDGRATEQLTHTDRLDGTKYHVYDLFVTPTRMWIEIDGKTTFQTTDQRFIPKGPGFFTVGKALTGRRDSLVRSQDAVVVDYVELYKPAG